METVIANGIGRTRRETRNGREYLVAPATLIVPGVLNGSKGRLFYPPEEVSKDPWAWNGMPMVVYHPTSNGQHVSGRDPDIIEKFGVGNIYRAQANGKLSAEAWFDVEATRRVDNRILRKLERNEPIELSTGLFTENEPTAGTYNGQPYDAIARNYKPDHLAILPDQTGACSLRDGCGVLVNAHKPLTRAQLVRRLLSRLAVNAGINQPKCPESGRWLNTGAGTGKGEAHKAAKQGFKGSCGECTEDEPCEKCQEMAANCGGPGSGRPGPCPGEGRKVKGGSAKAKAPSKAKAVKTKAKAKIKSVAKKVKGVKASEIKSAVSDKIRKLREAAGLSPEPTGRGLTPEEADRVIKAMQPKRTGILSRIASVFRGGK